MDPREQEIPPGKARVFTCILWPDETVSAPKCGNDRRFALTAWRRGTDADENWGSCLYYIRPRVKTTVKLLKGSWLNRNLHIEGKIEMEHQALYPSESVLVHTRLWLNSGTKATVWTLGVVWVGSSFVIDRMQFGNELVAQAWVDRTDTFGSSVSNELHLTNVEDSG